MSESHVPVAIFRREIEKERPDRPYWFIGLTVIPPGVLEGLSSSGPKDVTDPAKFPSVCWTKDPFDLAPPLEKARDLHELAARARMADGAVILGPEEFRIDHDRADQVSILLREARMRSPRIFVLVRDHLENWTEHPGISGMVFIHEGIRGTDQMDVFLNAIVKALPPDPAPHTERRVIPAVMSRSKWFSTVPGQCAIARSVDGIHWEPGETIWGLTSNFYVFGERWVMIFLHEKRAAIMARPDFFQTRTVAQDSKGLPIRRRTLIPSDIMFADRAFVDDGTGWSELGGGRLLLVRPGGGKFHSEEVPSGSQWASIIYRLMFSRNRLGDVGDIVAAIRIFEERQNG